MFLNQLAKHQPLTVSIHTDPKWTTRHWAADYAPFGTGDKQASETENIVQTAYNRHSKQVYKLIPIS